MVAGYLPGRSAQISRESAVRRGYPRSLPCPMIRAYLIPMVSSGSTVGAVIDSLYPRVLRAVRAAVHRPVCLYPMSNDSAAAVCTHRGQRMDRAFERIEDVRPSIGHDLEGLVILV